MALSNINLVDHLLSQNISLTSTQQAIEALVKWLKETQSESGIDYDALNVKLKNYMSHLSEKWRKSARNYNQLKTRFSSWVNNEFQLPTVKGM